jgi:hypothetical protein
MGYGAAKYVRPGVALDRIYKLIQRVLHEAPLVSLAALSNLDNALREQVPRFGSPIVGGHGLFEICNDSHAASNADARIIVVSTSKVCFPRSLSIDITLAHFLDGATPGLSTSPTCLRPLELLYASARMHEWLCFFAQLRANCSSSCFRVCLLGRLFEHQFSDLMLDGNRRRKFDLSSEPACVHWKLL